MISRTALAVLLALSFTACRAPSATPHTDEIPAFSPARLNSGERLRVVATTSIVADVVQNIGGEMIDLTPLMPLGTDPHAFEPTPQNMAAIANSHVVFANGACLETFLEPILQSAEAGDKIVLVSSGVALLQFGATGTQEQQDEHGGVDPHTWFDPGNVSVWVRNIEAALAALDPANAAKYKANADAYAAKLDELDSWIRTQTAQIPAANRKLVTDHTVFTYFAARYGFEQVGAVFPGYSTLASPSAKELASLEDAVHAQGVKAVFVGRTANATLAERLAQDTGIRLVFVYTGSLGEAGSPGNTYLAMMRANVAAIVGALR
jgi:ABC-type Zn uptake system ZnuABC Zn-binding protein ZnuA